MINITQGGWNWDMLDSPAECPVPQLWHIPSERVSAVLGPDGEPLRVGYKRPRIGFDLTPREARP